MKSRVYAQNGNVFIDMALDAYGHRRRLLDFDNLATAEEMGESLLRCVEEARLQREASRDTLS